MSSAPFVAEVWAALGGSPEALDRLRITGLGSLPSAYRVTDLAVASIGAAGLAALELAGPEMAGPEPTVTVDRAVASAWYGTALEPVEWELPDPWDPLPHLPRRGRVDPPAHQRAAASVRGNSPTMATAAGEATSVTTQIGTA